MGFAAKVGMGTALPVTEAYEFQDCDVGLRVEVQELGGVRGSRARKDDRVREVRKTVTGSLHLNPSVVDLRKLLPRILGAAETGGNPYTYVPAETLPGFYLVIDRVQRVDTYDGVKVDKATFKGQEGGILDLTLALEGLSESVGAAGSFPAISPDCTNGPFTFKEGVLTLAGTPHYMKSLEVTVDNVLNKNRFFNSDTRLSLDPMDRLITVNVVLPWNTASTPIVNTADAAMTMSAVFTHGTQVFTISLAKLRCPAQPIPVRGKNEELLLSLQGQAREDCLGTPDIQCTLTA
jgi:hypothetical protein